MKEIDEDAWAAVRRVLDWKRPTLTASEANDLTTVLSLLPEALTNPQPVLPSEPGAYHDAHGTLTIIDPRGKWRGTYGDFINPNLCPGPFTRLVPERPQVTRQQIASAIDEVVNKWAATGGGLASPLTERIADLVQAARA